MTVVPKNGTPYTISYRAFFQVLKSQGRDDLIGAIIDVAGVLPEGMSGGFVIIWLRAMLGYFGF